MRSVLNEKNGQEVAKRAFGKTDNRYWNDVIFKPTYRKDGNVRQVQQWAARIQWRGRRELFNLNTANKATAAAKAKEIYGAIVGAGWDSAFAKYKPQMLRKSLVTVGDFLTELGDHWAGRPKTFEDYCRSFRRIVSEICGIRPGSEKFDYVSGGRRTWIEKINRIKLTAVTPEKLNKWRIAFVKKAAGDPLKQRQARISCNSLMRQAKSLFAPKLLAHISLAKPETLPFDGVAFYKRESMRYQSTIEIESLVKDALAELPQEQLKVFLLATMAGLARNEIDKLEWKAFRWPEGFIRIEVTEHFAPKTSHRTGDVPIDPEVAAMFRTWHPKATGPFVVEGGEPKSGATYTHYRAQEHFDGLTAWLRAKGITAAKPLHELRKEFGSQICAKHGIYSASRMLRHGDISITAQHYLDHKGRVTLGMGNLLIAGNTMPGTQRRRRKSTSSAKASLPVESRRGRSARGT